MNKILGIFGLLIFVCLFTTVLSENFDTAYNLLNVTRRSALFGILGIGAAFVIITGGIDLSIGSVVCLAGCLLTTFVMDYQWPIGISLALVMLVSLGLGLLHGLLITKLKLQPFVVTLCGLLVYRGFARWFAADQPQGFRQDHNDGLRQLATGQPWIGYESNLATLMMAASALLAVYFLGRAWLQWSGKTGERTAALMRFGLAALCSAIGASQFLGGPDGLVLSIAGQRIALLPGPLLYYAGLLIFLPTAIAYIAGGFRHDLGRTWKPTLALILSAIVFVLVAYRMAPTFGQISLGDTELRDFGFLSLPGRYLRNLIMLSVFLSTGALMGSIAWLATSVLTASNQALKPLLLAVVASGVMTLAGMTKLPETAIPMPMLILAACGIVASIFLNQTIYGRYLLALGRNEEAARYSGINTDRMIILAYMICAGMAGLGAILFALDINNLQPISHGNLYELYAIAAAVLGGCSLRGGEGNILGVVIGAAVMFVLYNSINTLGIDTRLETVVIGVVILSGVIADEVVKRIVATKRAKLQVEA